MSNEISENPNGIFIYYSSCGNSIITNNITNNGYGIHAKYWSNNNLIYHNNLIDNSKNAYDECSNQWYNAALKEGNYYDSYKGTDADADGIGDMPYNISGGTNKDKDLYPLMKPYEEGVIFDTGTPANPYPSISGTHKGTITPNQTITLSKLYTYPCPGTGGHTEYVRIYGHGVDERALWNGYSGDWHNITFDSSFTIDSGKKYYYIIKTGSYPQIIHEREFNTKGGKITCSEFIDVNGKSYNDWIPAIRLE